MCLNDCKESRVEQGRDKNLLGKGRFALSKMEGCPLLVNDIGASTQSTCEALLNPR